MAAPLLPGESIQGYLADWKCTERYVKDGREKVLHRDHACSLMRNSARQGYGLITDEKKYYKLDDNGNKLAKELLNNSHDKDNLKVIAKGKLEGDTLIIETLSIL